MAKSSPPTFVEPEIEAVAGLFQFSWTRAERYRWVRRYEPGIPWQAFGSPPLRDRWEESAKEHRGLLPRNLELLIGEGSETACKPLAANPGLAEEFISLDGSRDSFADFHRRNGPLFRGAPSYGYLDAVHDFVAADMAALRDLARSRKRAKASSLAAMVLSLNDRIVKSVAFARPTFHLNLKKVRGANSLSIEMEPATLIDAIWLLVVLEATGEVNMRRCAYPPCGSWFNAGGDSRKMCCSREHTLKLVDLNRRGQRRTPTPKASKRKAAK